MKKKILAFLIALMMISSLTACNKSQNKTAETDSQPQSSQSSEQPSGSVAVNDSSSTTSQTDSSQTTVSDTGSSQNTQSNKNTQSNNNNTSAQNKQTGQTPVQNNQTPSKSIPVQQTPDKPTNVTVASVSISQSSATLDIGGTVSLSATVSPSNATDKSVSWSSSNNAVATVNGGTVTAKTAGTATITVSSGGRSASCSVTVNAPKPPTQEIDINTYIAYAKQYGQSIGLTWYDGLQGDSWNAPTCIDPRLSDETMKKNLRSDCDSLKKYDQAQYFKAVAQKQPDGTYLIYIYYA